VVDVLLLVQDLRAAPLAEPQAPAPPVHLEVKPQHDTPLERADVHVTDESLPEGVAAGRRGGGGEGHIEH